MKTLTALALTAVVVAGVSSASAHMETAGHMMRERQMAYNQMMNGRMVGMGTLSAEGNQNLMYYFGGPCPCPTEAAATCPPEPCAPVCAAPCPPEPVCPEPCAPVCAPVCEAPCPPPCPPKPLCCPDFRGWFDGYQCPCPTRYVAEVPCPC